MRKRVRLVIAMVLIAAFGIVAVMVSPWADTGASAADVQALEDSPGAALLRAALKPYADRTDFAGSFRITQAVTVGEETSGDSIEIGYRLRLPDMLVMELSMQGVELTIGLDTESCRAYFARAGKYLDLPMPEDVWELLGTQVAVPVSEPRVLAITFGLFGPDALAGLLADADGAEVSGEETLGDVQARRVVLRTEEDVLTVWVATEKPALLKAELSMTAMVEEVRDRMPDLKEIKLVIELDPPRADAPLAEDAFALNLPEDARRAEDMADLMQMDLTGREAEDFELAGLEEGTTWRLSDLKGQVVALDFWASWCGPCRAEMPLLAAIYKDLKDEGFVLLGVNVQEGREAVTDFLEETKLDIPVAMDTDGRVSGSYFVSGLPTLVLVGRDGVIQAVHEGYSPDIGKVVRQEVEALLAGESLLAE